MRKKRILFHTDFALAKSGFGRTAKVYLTELYKTGKYDIACLNCCIQGHIPDFERTPWKNYPAIVPEIQGQLGKDPNTDKIANYGGLVIDEVMKDFRPDVYIGVQDHWGVNFNIEKDWFKKIKCAFWVTLDSLPLLEDAVKCFPKVENYWVWSGFAEREAKRLGFNNVSTMHGPLETSYFHKLSRARKILLRQKFNLPDDAFIIGDVFRNQLRKSVPKLLEGYALFKKNNPSVKNTFLLLHTNFAEGWNIKKHAEICGVPEKEILCTYICRACGEFEVKPFSEQGQNCPHCQSQKSQYTVGVGAGVTEEQLNEVYNLMDVFVHAFTSGGQEIPIQEAKLCELITLVTNYSCGEDMCLPQAQSLPLKFSEYIEGTGTDFIKAWTSAESIAKELFKVYSMDARKREEMGKKARQWVIDNYSKEVIVPKLESFIDSSEYVSDDYKFEAEKRHQNPNAQIPETQDDKEWLKIMYKSILDMNVDDFDEGLSHWMKKLEEGMTRADIERFFRETAVREIGSGHSSIEDFLDKDDEGKRLAFVIPGSLGDSIILSSLLDSAKEQYPDYNIYIVTKPQYFPVFESNENVHKLIPYHPQFENLLYMEGKGEHGGYFEICFLPTVPTQKVLTWTHNAKDKIAFDLRK